MADIEEERKQLGQLIKELLVVMGDIEGVEKCIAAIRKEAVELYKEIDAKLNRKENKMGMPAFLLNGLFALGFRLLKEHIASDDDTSAVEEALVNAKSSDEVKVIVKKELLDTIDDQLLTDTDIPESVIDGLATANSKDEIVEVLNTAEGQRTFIDAMGSLLRSIHNLIFRRK